MPIPSYKEWITETKAGVFKTRSTKLKELDKALEDYWKAPGPGGEWTLKKKLKEWMETKDEWTDSIRNKKGAIEQLRAALGVTLGPVSTGWTAPTPDPRGAGRTYLSSSFGLANTLERTEIGKAVEHAKSLSSAAYRAIALIGGPGHQRDVYQRWFGAYDRARAQVVRKNINDIWGALHLRPVIVYYRGDKATGATDCAAETGQLSPGGYYGAAWQPQNLPGTLDRAYTYLFVGSAFFTSTHFGSDCTGGVFIHELSHAICGTDDVIHDGAPTYGPEPCKKLAIDLPAKAIQNADCYEYFSEEMQSGMYRPNPLGLNLPPKASIQLVLAKN